MFAYLSKKITIPGDGKVRTVSWSAEQGWLACGCDNGLLKVIQLEPTTNLAAKAAAGAPAAQPQSQNLEGHSGSIICSSWNHPYLKLTTSDENGLIIVWVYTDTGDWVEEMVNNRNKSVVRDMRWAPSGEKICIIYEDGAVIVGSVDGNRLWGKELEMHLRRVEWSQDGRYLLFADNKGGVHVFDGNGNGVTQVPMYCNEGYAGISQVVALEWYDGLEGSPEPDCPALAICLDNGRMQLMRHDVDDNAVCIDTGMRPVAVKWNNKGSLLAVAGSQVVDGRELWMVQFFNHAGEHLRTLRVPGQLLSGIAWEGDGLRLCLAVDSQLYFASVRYSRHWGYLENSLVYSFNKVERPEDCVMFWDTRTNERYAKYVRGLQGIKAAGRTCLLTTRGEAPTEYILILCNAIGSPIDSKYIEVEPRYVALTETCVIVASEEVVYVWQQPDAAYRLAGPSSSDGGAGTGGTSGGGLASSLKRDGRERLMFIDAPDAWQAPDLFQQPTDGCSDPIAAITANATTLIVGRSSGVVYRYALPSLALTGQHLLRCRPQQLALNCDATKLGVIDFSGVFSFFDTTLPGAAGGGTSTVRVGASGLSTMTGDHVGNDRKDVWDMCWAGDNPDLCAIMEKGRMFIFRGLEPEEPITSNAVLAGFNDLEVRGALLDEVMLRPDAPALDMVVTYEARSLRDTRALLASTGFDDAAQFIADNPHPRLWRLLAEAALEKLDWGVAEKAFVHCQDYKGLQLVRHLAGLDQRAKQEAEVAVYFSRLEAAEELYRGLDRLDLAVALRAKLGDWFRVEKLLKESSGSDQQLVRTWNKIGQYYSDRQKWAKAAHYYTQARNTAMLLECFYALEDFTALVALTEVLPEGEPLLLGLGVKLQSVGLCSEAVAAFLKAGDSKAAIDCCVLLHQWDQAMSLAAAHAYPQAEQLLAKYAGHLLDKKRYMETVELYKKAGKHSEAAKLLVEQAQQLAAAKGPPLRIKQLYVLAALEVEAFRKQALEAGGGDAAGAAATLLSAAGGGTAAAAGTLAGKGRTSATMAAQTLAGLMTMEAVSSPGGGDGRAMDAAWHGAEAYHFWLLAHRQLYSGQVEAALRTALALRGYEDVLPPADIWALLGLAAFYAGFYGQCSKAFVKLEALSPKEQRQAYADLAMAIFVAHPPVDPRALKEAAAGKKGGGAAAAAAAGGGKRHRILEDLLPEREQVCVASGRSLRDAQHVRCKTCRHGILSSELPGRAACPLCHAALPAGLTAERGGGGGAAGAGGGGGRSKQARAIEAIPE